MTGALLLLSPAVVSLFRPVGFSIGGHYWGMGAGYGALGKQMSPLVFAAPAGFSHARRAMRSGGQESWMWRLYVGDHSLEWGAHHGWGVGSLAAPAFRR